MWESFFATLECELLDRQRFKNQLEARLAVFDFIEGWYNPHRRHSALAYESPVNYERQPLCESKCETVQLSTELNSSAPPATDAICAEESYDSNGRQAD